MPPAKRKMQESDSDADAQAPPAKRPRKFKFKKLGERIAEVQTHLQSCTALPL